MNNSKQNWTDVLNSMGVALQEMRVNYEQEVKLKNFTDIKNPLLQKRLAKAGNSKKLKIPLETLKIEPITSTLKPSVVNNNDDDTNNEDQFSNSSRMASKIEGLKLKRQYSEPARNSTLKALYYSFDLRDI